MIALSRVLSIGILLFLVAVWVFVFALMKTSARADRMSQRWIEKQWLADHPVSVDQCNEQVDCPAPVFHHLSTCASGMGSIVRSWPKQPLYDQETES